MVVYVSMALWVPFIYSIYSMMNKRKPLVSLGDTDIKVEKVSLIYIVLIFGYFCFWIGFRSYIADTTVDIDMFNKIPSEFSEAWNSIKWNGKSPGYDIFNVLFKSFISTDYTLWLFTIAIICLCFIISGIRRYSINIFYSSYLFITLLIYSWMINGMRQFICVAIFFGLSHWLEEKKLFRILLLSLILYTIHITAVIIIPVYFVAKSRPWSIQTFLVVIATIIISIFAEPIFFRAEGLLVNYSTESYVAQFQEQQGVNFLRFAITAVFPAMALWKRKSLERYYGRFPILPILTNMSLITSSIFFVGMFTSGILVGRLPIYTEIFNMVFIPYLIYLGFNEREQLIIKPLLTVILFIYFYLKTPPYYISSALNVQIQGGFF